MKLYGQTTPAQSGYVRQSYAGIIRQRLIAIERTIGTGVRHERIRQMLVEEGHSASIGTFRKSLSRARIWWRVQLQQLEFERQGHKQTESVSAALPATTYLDASKMQARNREQDNTNNQDPAHGTELVNPSRLVTNRTIQPPPKTNIDLDEFFRPKSVFVKPGQ